MDPYLSQLPGGDAEYLQTVKTGAMARYDSIGEPDGLFGKEGMTFHDVLEVFNPLQHLPIIGNIYRELTGDELKPGVRLIGGLLFGGPTGLASAAVNVVVEYNTGHDIGGEVLALVEGKPLVTDEARARIAANDMRRQQMIADGLVPGVPQGATQLAAQSAPAASQATTSDAAPGPAAPAADAKPVQLAAASVAPPAKGSIGVPPVTAPAAPTQAALASSFPGNGMPAGLATDATGLTGKSGLPSAGSITPAALVAMLGQQQPQGNGGRAAGTTPAMAAALPIAGAIGGPVLPAPPTAEQQAADQAARQQAAESAAENTAPALRMPPRLSIDPRMPAPGKSSAARTPIIVPPDAITATASSGATASPTSDAPIILGTPNAAPASLTPTAQIPDAMLRALDKYDALIKNRHGGGKVVDQAT